MPVQVETLQPDPEALAELAGMRLRDLKLVSRRLGRVERLNWPNLLGVGAVLLLGADIGGWISMLPYRNTDPEPSRYDLMVYTALLLGTLAVALVALLGALIARRERVESVHDIKSDLDELLSAWEREATTNGGAAP